MEEGIYEKLSNGLYHIRFKGIPQASIDLVTAQQFSSDPLTLYKHLFEGNSVEFDLLETGVRFSLHPGSVGAKISLQENYV